MLLKNWRSGKEQSRRMLANPRSHIRAPWTSVVQRARWEVKRFQIQPEVRVKKTANLLDMEPRTREGAPGGAAPGGAAQLSQGSHGRGRLGTTGISWGLVPGSHVECEAFIKHNCL